MRAPSTMTSVTCASRLNEVVLSEKTPEVGILRPAFCGELQSGKHDRTLSDNLATIL